MTETPTPSQPIPVVVNGATGKMGREVIRAVSQATDMNLVGAIVRRPDLVGQDIGEVVGCGALEVVITQDLQGTLAYAGQEGRGQKPVMVDFTHPDCVYDNIRAGIAYGICPVVGTTGLTSEQLKDLSEFAIKASMGGLVIPNFSIGMVLLQQAAIAASRFYQNLEIIELHHNQKADAPSGTALQTAQLLAELGQTYNEPLVAETEKVAGARGAEVAEGIRIHSIRLPGLIAHQELIFGAPGELYTLRHDTSDRACYMPGVLLAIRKVQQLEGLIYGLDKIL
ncbi:MAG: 4-hydroxy-tetrahydrodipicolinate reductase [Prochlorotrichaceae cyanobacterium]